MSEKLQKVLARAGVGSRREMEQVISAGRVSVNGEVAKLGDRVDDEAIIRLDGAIVALRKAEENICRVLAYHKPEGEVCSRKDPEGRPTVFERLPRIRNGRWVAVGRLDLNTSGLLLFTTDGELASRLMHPSYELDREYAVRVFGEVTREMVLNLTSGVMLEDGLASFDDVQAAGGEGINKWFHVALHEGKNREVRRLWESQGVQVSRLTRVRYGKVNLPRSLAAGAWMELPLDEVNELRESVQLAHETRTLLDQKEQRPKNAGHKLRRTADRSRARQQQRHSQGTGANRKKPAKPSRRRG